MKFELENNVKIVKNTLGEMYDSFLGKEGKIVEIDNSESYPYRVEGKDGEDLEWWGNEELELIEESIADTINNHINGLENKENKEEPMTYLGGDLLKKGSIMLREKEAEELRLVGAKLYSPIEDKEINDKSSQTKESNDGLAEKIVKKDTKAIIDSDIIIIEPQDNALGTMVELGQVKGMKDASIMIMNTLNKFKEDGRCSYSDLYKELEKLQSKLDKKVYPHYEDIRRTNIEECGDRRSLGINQYVYGVCLDLTDGKGFYEWDEIVKEMKELHTKEWHREYISKVEMALEKSKELHINKKSNMESTHILLSVAYLYEKSEYTNIEDFYNKIFDINKANGFDKYIFVSRYNMECGKIEVDYAISKELNEI